MVIFDSDTSAHIIVVPAEAEADRSIGGAVNTLTPHEAAYLFSPNDVSIV